MSSMMYESALKPYDGKLDFIAENHKDAFLGRSKGILNSFGNEEKDFDVEFKLRQKRKMRKVKALVHSHYVPD